jgi:[protein]-arginine 3-hydroxylase / protease
MRNTSQAIERVEKLSPEVFYRDFVRRNRPVVIRGVVDQWPALARWSPEYLGATYADARVLYTAWESDNPANDPTDYYRTRKRHWTTLGEFVARMQTGADSSRNYLTQFRIFHELPQLSADVRALDPFMRIPAYLPATIKRRLKKAPTLWLGPAETVTPIHFDGADNLLVQVFGRKRLTLIPPAQSACLYYPCLRLGHVNYSPVDVEEPDYARFPRYKDATPLEVTIEPGEMLFIPVRWWHHARSLTPSISLNFWWYSARSLLRMRHPYFVYQKSRLLRRIGLSQP